MADKVIRSVIDKLLSDNSIATTTQGRVFAGHISNAPQPIYPCITVERQVPGNTYHFVPLSDYDIVITAYSEKSYDETSDLLDSVRSNIASTNTADATGSWVICTSGTPYQGSQMVEKIVFYLRETYRVYRAG